MYWSYVVKGFKSGAGCASVSLTSTGKINSLENTQSFFFSSLEGTVLLHSIWVMV